MLSYSYVRRQRSPVTEALIVANVVVFVAELVAGSRMIELTVLVAGYLLSFREMWRLLTHMFMHLGFFHLFFNMWALYVFGREIEEEFGARTLLAVYFASGVAGAYLFSAVNVLVFHQPEAAAAGASAAIFGLVAFYVYQHPNRRMVVWFVIPIVMSAKAMAILYISIELIRAVASGFREGSYLGHLGGFAAGLIASLIASRRARRAKVLPSYYIGLYAEP